MNKKSFYISIIVIFFFVLASFWGIKLYGAQKAKKEFENFIKFTNLDEFYEIKVENFDFNPFTREFIFKDLYIKPKFSKNKSIDIDELRLKYEQLKEGFIFSLKTKDLKSTFRDEEIYQYGNLKVKYQNKTLEFQDENEIKTYFRLKTKFELDNFDRKIFSLFAKLYKFILINFNDNLGNAYPYLITNEDFILLVSKLVAIIPKEIELEYEENGFADKLLENLAKEIGKPKETLKKELIKEIKIEMQKEKDENLKKLLEAFVYFLENKRGKLKIELENKDSLSIQDMIALYIANRDLDTFIEKLSDKITFKVEFEE